jgi:hypothetical protein
VLKTWLPKMFGEPGEVEGDDAGVTCDEEYQAFDELGPRSKIVVGEWCSFKWSCVNIVREMRNRNLNFLSDDDKIATEILRWDKKYRGSPTKDGNTMPTS